jgi:hypothetical protein
MLEIQKRFCAKVVSEKESRDKAFNRLTFTGQISKALKFIDNDEDAAIGVLPLDSNVKATLMKKHPESRGVTPNVLFDTSNVVKPEPVLFESIDADEIIRTAKEIGGSGGQTKCDADLWQHLLCSKIHEKQSEELAQAISDLTKLLCTEKTYHQVFSRNFLRAD